MLVGRQLLMKNLSYSHQLFSFFNFRFLESGEGEIIIKGSDLLFQKMGKVKKVKRQLYWWNFNNIYGKWTQFQFFFFFFLIGFKIIWKELWSKYFFITYSLLLQICVPTVFQKNDSLNDETYTFTRNHFTK